MRTLRSAAAMAALVLTLGACGSAASTTEAAAPAADTSAADAAAEVVVSPAIEGTFTTVAGGQLDLGALAGQDTVLWFWAPW